MSAYGISDYHRTTPPETPTSLVNITVSTFLISAIALAIFSTPICVGAFAIASLSICILSTLICITTFFLAVHATDKEINRRADDLEAFERAQQEREAEVRRAEEARKAQIAQRLDQLEKSITLPPLPELPYDIIYEELDAYRYALQEVMTRRLSIFDHAVSSLASDFDYEYRTRGRNILLGMKCETKVDDDNFLLFFEKFNANFHSRKHQPQFHQNQFVDPYSIDFALKAYVIDPTDENHAALKLYNTFRQRLETKTRCPFTILGVEKNADFSLISKSFRSLSVVLHPDKNIDERKEEATLLFKVLKEAYDCLKPKTEQKKDIKRFFKTFTLKAYAIDTNDVNHLDYQHYNTFRSRLEMGIRCPYTLLGLPKNADFSTATDSYLTYSSALNPHKHNQSFERHMEANLLLKILNEAYECLRPV